MLTANDIRAMCTKHGHTLAFGGISTLKGKLSHWNDGKACPRKTLANECGIDYFMYHPAAIATIYQHLGLSEFDQDCLEFGFERPDDPDNEIWDNYYYGVGRELRTQVEVNNVQST